MVNHVVELSEEEKKQARQEAIKQYQQEEFVKLQKRNERPKKAESADIQPQPSLFDFWAYETEKQVWEGSPCREQEPSSDNQGTE